MNLQISRLKFPDNSKEGHKTESLPIIWEDKENFGWKKSRGGSILNLIRLK